MDGGAIQTDQQRLLDLALECSEKFDDLLETNGHGKEPEVELRNGQASYTTSTAQSPARCAGWRAYRDSGRRNRSDAAGTTNGRCCIPRKLSGDDLADTWQRP